MRRRDIQLLASARQGDTAARCEAGRRYLLGADFPRSVTTGLDYLTHPSVAGSTHASTIIAESLPLHDVVRMQQWRALSSAAENGSRVAQAKFGAWLLLTRRDPSQAMKWLALAAAAGSGAAAEAQAAMSSQAPDATKLLRASHAISKEPGIDLLALTRLAIAEAMSQGDDELITRNLALAIHLAPGNAPDVADCVCTVLERAELREAFHLDVDRDRIERCLEACATRGNAQAALMLGRALCGISVGPLRADKLVSAPNMRKGAALLLRAADAGKDQAWLLLYGVHSNHRASVANPQMARFFLEKAATRGDTLAQRRLGALVLRSATTLHESEQGIHWLHEAMEKGDASALRLLQSLVLPVAGDEDAASSAIESLRRDDPWMACRLRTARDFGLTKLEALSVDIAKGFRSWGLVVGINPFIVQSKLSSARAIPAVTAIAARNLRLSAAFFQQSHQNGGASIEGDLRKRSHRLRRWLDRHGVDESLFFSDARSTTLNALRLGTKWAFHARQPLRQALGA